VFGINPFKLYGWGLALVVATCQGLSWFFSSTYVLPPFHWELFFSAAAEGLALVVLRQRIIRQRSVEGISAQCLVMFLFSYASRAVSLPSLSVVSTNFWGLKVLDWAAFGILIDVFLIVKGAYRDAPHDQLDIVKGHYLMLGCFLLTCAYRPSRASGRLCGFMWTFGLYVDQLSFLPQVVLMARQQRPVAGPIAHFVVATAISRISDLGYWTTEFRFWSAPRDMSFSGWFLLATHMLSVTIIIDFLYYFIRACFHARSLAKVVDINNEDV
jgi:hypothetical protein